MHTPHRDESLKAAIERLRTTLPAVVDRLKLDVSLSAWESSVDQKVLPRTAPDFPLVAAVCGGGSAGKSSLFNAMIQAHVSPTGGTAGINRRILISGNERLSQGEREFAGLFEAFGFRPKRLRDQNELTRPGGPRYVLNTTTPENLILIDTPDFDTGSNHAYRNREIARQALDVSDILVYIFTNANYNNRDNTDFIADVLTGIGRRKCFLVYRVYASYPESEIVDHARTVAQNIYGSDSIDQVLGVYRAEEDNRVAAADMFVNVQPVGKDAPPFMEALTGLRRERIRSALMRSVLRDVVHQAEDLYQQARISLAALALYGDALQAWQSQCVRQALKRFPMDAVFKRFVEIWQKTDPAHVRWMRRAGGAIDLPVRAAVKTVRWFRGTSRSAPEKSHHHQAQYAQDIKEDFLKAANDLWRKFRDADVSVAIRSTDPAAKRMRTNFDAIRQYHDRQAGVCPHQMQPASDGRWIFSVQAHPAVGGSMAPPSEWTASIESKLSDPARPLLEPIGTIDHDLEQLARSFRSRMTVLAKMRQSFAAFLNVLPATLAVTYILSTGDPVGAAGVKIKLSGLFGLKDLYALVALPATTGLRRADRAQLEALMGPIAKTWLDHKLVLIQTIFEETISGGTLAAVDQIDTQAQASLAELQSALRACRQYASGSVSKSR